MDEMQAEKVVEGTEEKGERQRRTTYYLATGVQEFATKKCIEDHLTKQGGLQIGQVLLRGASVEAKPEKIFKI